MKFKLPGLGFLKRGKGGIDVEDLDEYEDYESEGLDDDEDTGGIAPEPDFDDDDDDEDVDIAVEEPGEILGDGADDVGLTGERDFVGEPPETDEDEEFVGGDDDYVDDEPDFDDEEDEEEGGGGALKEKLAGLLAPVTTALSGAVSGLRPKIETLLGTGKRRIAILAGAGVIGLCLLGSLGWAGYAIFSGGDEEAVAEQVAGEATDAEDLGDKLRRRNIGLGLKTLDESGAPVAEGAPPGEGVEAPPAEVPGAVPFGAPAPGEEENQGTQALSLNEIARQEAASSISGVMVAAVPKGSYSRLPKASEGEHPLDDLPDPGLLEQRGTELLPITDPAGRTSYQHYARPAEIDAQKPAVAIIVGGLALSRNPTEAAIWNLPGTVTLAFEPYGANLEAMVSRAREAGHEVLLTVPMATESFPLHDPGPGALQVALDPMENTTRLEDMLASMTRYVGVIGTMGSSIVTRDDMVRPILATLKQRGLMYVDGSQTKKSLVPAIASEIGLPRAIVNLEIDEDPARGAIDARLADLERAAREAGAAVGFALPYPSTLERLNAWIQTLPSKGLVLAPVTALADRQLGVE